MENTMKEKGAEVICIRCAHANPERASRCDHCGSPLDDFARGVPWEMGTANSNAYSERNPTKPIIFWGAWLYFGLSGLASIAMIYHELRNTTGTTLSKATLLPLLIPGIYTAVCIYLLWSVTKNRK